MTEYPVQLIRRREPPEGDKPRHPLAELDACRFAKHLALFRPGPETLDALVAKAKASIPGLTNTDVVRRIVAHNPDCLWAIARKARCKSQSFGDGFIAMLPLTETGLRLLAINGLDTRDPNPAFITAPNER